jgi:hypothetical protein
MTDHNLWHLLLVEDVRHVIRGLVIAGADVASALALAMTCKDEYEKRRVQPGMSYRTDIHAMCHAARHGHVALLEWWAPHANAYSMDNAFYAAVSAAQIGAAEWFVPQHEVLLAHLAAAVHSESIPMLEWVRRHLPPSRADWTIITNAAVELKSCVPFLDWALVHCALDGIVPESLALHSIVQRNYAALRWTMEHFRANIAGTNLIKELVLHGASLSTVQWIHSLGFDNVREDVHDIAARRGDAAMCAWLAQVSPPFFPPRHRTHWIIDQILHDNAAYAPW